MERCKRAPLATKWVRTIIGTHASAAGAAVAKTRTVVIVGGGLSGLCAALEAQRAGARVVLLEQEAALGGNSAKASSGLNGAPTPWQRDQGIHDSVEAFVADTRKSGRGRDQPELVHILAHDSADAVAFLEREGGLELSIITLLGGHGVARTHRARLTGRPTNVGLAIVQALERRVAQLADHIVVRTNARLKDVLLDTQGRVRAVSYVNATSSSSSSADAVALNVECDAVIMATGGYATDREGLLRQHTPHLMALPSTNTPWRSAGDGVRIAQRLGAELALMDAVQVHPTGLVDPKHPDAPYVILAGEALRGNGGVFVNAQGKRFCNELTYRDATSDAIFVHGSRIRLSGGESPVAVYLLLNDAAVAKFPECERNQQPQRTIAQSHSHNQSSNQV